ncbi:hypothetical protein [Kitasatospora sp. NPDC015120]|uniref:hypothetical protein n=1 Tax=Kitasatospora sp. NPDC015120 TaxID=3364023 RepID=UPI0036F4513B
MTDFTSSDPDGPRPHADETNQPGTGSSEAGSEKNRPSKIGVYAVRAAKYGAVLLAGAAAGVAAQKAIGRKQAESADAEHAAEKENLIGIIAGYVADLAGAVAEIDYLKSPAGASENLRRFGNL